MLGMEDSRAANALAGGVRCRACRMVPPAFDGAVSFGLYEDELRDLIHLLKFDHVPATAKLLAAPMARAIADLAGVAARDLLVVAVPLHRQRLRQRGYNQSVLLADAAIARLKLSHPAWELTQAHSVLIRRRPTESQWVLAPRGRRRNLEGAFAIPDELRDRVRGREILLVDDIMTSGATAREAARVLKRAGAAKVWVATLARAQRASAFFQPAAEAEVARWDLNVEFVGEPEHHPIQH
jgi:ComF family protein